MRLPVLTPRALLPSVLILIGFLIEVGKQVEYSSPGATSFQ